MQVTRVDGDNGTTFDLRGMTSEQAAMLGALADFPLWGRQPERVRAFCVALHTSAGEALGYAPGADAHGMTPDTTVDLN